jgi:hypothetical protein
MNHSNHTKSISELKDDFRRSEYLIAEEWPVRKLPKLIKQKPQTKRIKSDEHSEDR